MSAKTILGLSFALAVGMNAQAQLVRSQQPAKAVETPVETPATAPQAAAPAAVPAPSEAPAPLRLPGSARKPEPALVPASVDARESIGDQASKARFEAAKPAEQQVPAIAIRADAGPGAGSSLVKTEQSEPRLLSIVGQYGRERADVAFDGFVYTVSKSNPRLGASGWRLTDIDATNSTVHLERGGSEEDDKLGGKKGASKRPSKNNLVLGFSRKDSDAVTDARTTNR